MESIFGKLLQTTSGIHEISSIIPIPIKCIFFSAAWCPQCIMLTPALKEFYAKANEKEKQLEIINVSKDISLVEFTSFASTMPWCSVPYHPTRCQKILDYYGVQGIPKLILVDSEANLLKSDCKNDIQSMGIDCLEEWKDLIIRND